MEWGFFLIKVGKPHDRLCGARGAPDAASKVAAGLGCLLRLGASSTNVHVCLWNWHITQAIASEDMTQRLFLLRQPSQGRSGRMLGPRGLGTSLTRALVGDVIPLTLLDPRPVEELPAVLGSIRGGGIVESMIIMGWIGPASGAFIGKGQAGK